MKAWVIEHKLLAILVGLVIILAATLLVWVETSRAPAPSDGRVQPGVETTIEGEVVCLPHKDTDGPQTLECAYGVKLTDGTYYGLSDSDGSYGSISSLPTGQKARLTGTLKEGPSDKYQSVGTFTVTNADVVE